MTDTTPTQTDLSPRVSRLHFTAIVAMALTIPIVLGFVAGRYMYDEESNSLFSDYPRSLDDTERHDALFIVQPTEPMTIRLKIVSRKEFEMRDPKKNILAFTYISRNPCEIVIPAGWQIVAVPDESEAWWENSHNGDTLAHEILHCLRLSWHPHQ